MRLVCLFALASLSFAAELPVKTVILYKHGVGFFERSGELRSGESARLDFKASDMNDVLKSLTLEDKSGAKITGLRYDASEPIDKRLADYPFQIGQGKSLPDFLDQLKGARLSIRTVAGENASGIIFGSRRVAWGEKSVEKELVVLVVDSGEMRTYDLSAVTSLKLADAELERQMKDYLATLAVARSRDKRSVYIDSTDARARQVTASYMTPMPAWKSSYRLILKDAAATLEGWAIVDNTTGEDWTNVRLALVSGRPISFISKLYEPRYRTRPEGDLAEDKALGPTVYSGNVEAASMAKPVAPPPQQKLALGYGPARQAMELAISDQTAAFRRNEMASSVAATAAGRELGDLFEYSFSSPVTVKKNESAMLPFLQQKIGARKLLIYSDRSMQNPMNAAEITNNTGKTLDGGPITVYDSGAYAGEALVETFKATDKRLISYGVDLGTRITTAIDSSRELTRELHASRGVMTSKSAVQETLTFTVRNIDAKDKTLIIEHPIRSQYKLLNQKPAETTTTAYRFEVKLGANKVEKFPLSEEYIFDQTISIGSLTPDIIATYAQNKNLSADGRRQLEAVIAQKERIAATAAELQDVENQLKELAQDQDRIRRNLESLNRVTGQQAQVQKYATDLAAQESKLAQLRDRQSQLRKQRDSQQQALNAMIEKVAF
ncbi:MAG: DUF4139 domain-containing protein [Acidobacteria bacterium]|nr:DUF4139 domain-containing protein [Acidobacteriota bacterium]